MQKPLISSDSHVFEPDDLWTRTLGMKYGDALPRRVDGRPGDKQRYVYDFTGEEYVRKFGEVEEYGGKADETNYKSAGWDPAFRLRCMEEDVVYAELLACTTGLFLLSGTKHDMVRDCIRVFNDWLVAYASQAPGRLLRCAMIHMQDVDWAITELERQVKSGARCVMINGDTRPDWPRYRSPHYDRFWACAQEFDIPVQLHILTGTKRHPLMLREDEFGDMARLHLDFANDIGPVIGSEFIFGGVLDRFPRLKLVVGEYEVSWVPYWLFRLEQLNESFAPEYRMARTKRPPREYLSQIYFGVVDDPNLRHVDGIVGADRLLWGSDFPHTRNTFRKSHEIVRRIFAHLGEAGIDQAGFENATKLFKVDKAEAVAWTRAQSQRVRA